jgi:hypothetical protein
MSECAGLDADDCRQIVQERGGGGRGIWIDSAIQDSMQDINPILGQAEEDLVYQPTYYSKSIDGPLFCDMGRRHVFGRTGGTR